MQAESIIRQAHQAGIELFLAGDKIAARPKSKLSADLRQLIKAHREEVIRTLQDFSLSNFVKLVQHYGADSGILLEQSEILAELDSEGIEELRTASTEVRQSWAEAIATRLVQVRRIVPKGWDKIAHCQHCGPVWSEHDLDTISCGWCHMRLAGKRFPVPDKDE